MPKLITVNDETKFILSGKLNTFEELRAKVSRVLSKYVTFTDTEECDFTVKHLHLYKKAVLQDVAVELTDVRENFTEVQITQDKTKPFTYKYINGVAYPLEETTVLPIPVEGSDSEALSRVLKHFMYNVHYNDENGLQSITDTPEIDCNSLIANRHFTHPFFTLTLLDYENESSIR